MVRQTGCLHFNYFYDQISSQAMRSSLEDEYISNFTAPMVWGSPDFNPRPLTYATTTISPRLCVLKGFIFLRHHLLLRKLI